MISYTIRDSKTGNLSFGDRYLRFQFIKDIDKKDKDAIYIRLEQLIKRGNKYVAIGDIQVKYSKFLDLVQLTKEKYDKL